MNKGDEHAKSDGALQKWLSGDDAALITWLVGDVEGYSGESFELRKRIMQLEDERKHLLEEIETLRGGVGNRTLDEIVNSHPVLRNRLERYRLQIKDLRNKIDIVADQLDPETKKYLKIKEYLDEAEAEMRGLLQSLLERSESTETLAEQVSKLKIKLEEETPELERQIDGLSAEIENKRIAEAIVKEKLEMVETDGTSGRFDERIKELENWKEERLSLERENQRLRVQLDERIEELNRLRNLMRYKEEELARREEDLMYRERIIEEERKRFALEKEEIVGLDEIRMKKRLESLRQEIQAKEEELRIKERYINRKMEELRRQEMNLIEEEIDIREEERKAELGSNKVHTGNQRLNDLLLGGYPFGSNILIYGPSFVGKEVLVNQFIAEGLSKGVPVLWVLTDRTPMEIRKEMELMISGYTEYEDLGLVRYVDAYSNSVDEPKDDPHTIYLESPDKLNEISSAVDEIAAEFKKKYDYYRLGFRSLSTLIAYSNINEVFRFLSPFIGKRKKERAVSLFILEKGVQEQEELQMLSMIMDGMLDFNVDQQRHYFSVRGITDAQTRNEIRYTWTARGLNIGSFTLDHIK
ncbi:MAG: hypothetical protein PWQ88_869 [Candidatus Methanomethylophilaceae archaeon]|nr:hypothetical protein [Candidatus Methanomethylophilaceae archaeon]